MTAHALPRTLIVAAAATLAFLFTAPANAAEHQDRPETPCFACTSASGTSDHPTPTGGDGTGGNFIDNPADDPTPPEDRKIDGTSRTENFLTGQVQPGVFDATPYNAWYIQDEHKVEVFGADVGSIPDGGDMLWGQTSDLFFTGYKSIIHPTITYVGLLAFGLLFVSILLEPALRLAESFRSHIVDPAGLATLALVIAATYGLYLSFRRRYGTALTETGASLIIVAILATMLIPGDAVRWLVSLVAGAAGVILIAGSGGDPRTVPAASTQPIDTSQIMAAYQQFTGGLEELMIGKVAQIITFGDVLPAACQEAYQKGLDLHLTTTDPDNFKYLNAIEACQPYVEQAAQPDAPRAFFAFCLLLYAFVFAAAYIYLAWPALKGQLQLMVATAGHPFLLVAAALPGTFRATAVRLIIVITLGVAALVIFSLYLAGMLLGMTAVFAGTEALPMFVRLIAVLLVPLSLIFLQRRQRKAERSRATELTRAITHRAPAQRENPMAQRANRYATRTIKTAATAAAGGAAGAAVTITKRTGTMTAQGTKAAVVGTDTRRGLVLGPRTTTDPAPETRADTDRDSTTTTAPRPKPTQAAPSEQPTRQRTHQSEPRKTTAGPTKTPNPAQPAPRPATRKERVAGGTVGTVLTATGRTATLTYRETARATRDAIRADAAETRARQDAERTARQAMRPDPATVSARRPANG